MKRLFLALDTSNYTTSSALCDEDGEILLDFKRLLPVKEGERGLRQSDAVFHHVKALPDAANEVRNVLSWADGELTAVGVSASPRDSDGSYMPCFLSGIAAAEYASASHGVPLYRFSHQAGHIMAALSSACKNSGTDREKMLAERFLAFHVSGGTTDLLLVEPDVEKIIKITEIGGSRDLHAGQVIDRTGVRMGLSFPCGAEMDKAALAFDGRVTKCAVSVDRTYCNLSGLENKAAEMWQKTGDVGETSAFVLMFVARTLEKMTLEAFEEYGRMPVVYAGGVMASGYIKQYLSRYGMFSSPEYSSDNAAGVALLTAEKYRREHK